MKKKFAVVKVHGYNGTFISVMNKDEYCTCLCDCDVLFESDNTGETSDFYKNFTNSFGDK